jgi:hypothetical protein
LTPALLLLTGFGVLLLVLFVRVLVDFRKVAKAEDNLTCAEEFGRRHVTYFPQVRQALAVADLDFLSLRGSRKLSQRVRKERRKIALAYLSCLRDDFFRLWRLARIISSLSPRVGVGQEFARLRLGLTFSLRYQMLRTKFLCGFAPIPELGSLSEAVSRLAIRLETAMNDLGERAALAAKLASTLDGRRLDTP